MNTETVTTENVKVTPGTGANFLLLLLGRIISDLGSAIAKFGMSLYILDITGSAVAFSVVLIFSTLPGVFVNIAAGVFVDKNNKKKIMILSDFLSGGLVLAFMLLLQSYPASLLLFAGFVTLINIAQSFFSLALNASIANIVSEEHTAKANSVMQSVGALLNVLGPIIGAVVYSTIGYQTMLVLDGASFLLAGCIAMALKIRRTSVDTEAMEQKSYWENTKDVFRYLNTQKGIEFILMLVVVINFFFMPLIVLVLPYINYNIIKISGFQLSLVQSSWAVGMIVGAIFVSTRKSATKILKKMYVLLSLQAVLILLWVFPTIGEMGQSDKWLITILFSVILILIGFFNSALNIPAATYLQTQIPEEFRGRVFGIVNTANLLSAPLGLWMYGLLLDRVNWSWIIIISGIALVLITILSSRNKHSKAFLSGIN